MSKLAVITGADGGMGKEITRAVAEAGYHVIMLCYTLFKGEERKNQMILETGNKEIEVRQVDLSSMASVINVWGIERSGFFNGREKWAKGFENQRV